MFLKQFIFTLSCLCVLSPGAALSAERPTYGPRLEGYDYPHPVKSFEFNSQNQTLSMSYMDLTPADPSNNKDVVLLHGKNFCGATWEPTIQALTNAGYRVIVPDQIGFCKSSKPIGYQFSFGQLAANTNALLHHLNIEKPIIIGHSIGGMLAMRYALQYPNEVERLALINPIGLEDWQQKGVPYASIDQLYQKELKTSFDSIKAYQKKMYYGGKWKPAYDAPVGMLAGMYQGTGGDLFAYIQAQTSEMLFTQPVVHELDRIKVPTLLFIGMKDKTAPGSDRAPKDLQTQLGDYPKLAKTAEGKIPNAKLIAFDDMGHAPQMEQPEIFHRALLKALKESD
jgi:pimeloyl-ACP methyl ester carboxylesterase